MMLFAGLFSAVNGYGIDKLADAHVFRPVAKFLGFDVPSETQENRVSEPIEQPWLYQSGAVGGAFATDLDGERVVLVLNCEERSSSPYLSLSLFVPDYIEDQEVLLTGFAVEFREKGHVELDFRLSGSLRYPLELEPSRYNEDVYTVGWNVGFKGNSTSPNTHVLREFVSSMLARDSSLNIYSSHNQTAIPIAVNTHGLRYLAQETRALEGCI